MNSDYGGNRKSRRAGPLAVLAAVAVLTTATACSGSTAPADTAPGGSQQAVSRDGTAPGGNQQVVSRDVKFARCMRAHGATDFPDPRVAGNGVHFQGTFNFGTPQWQQAERACKSLAPAGFFPASS